MCGIAGVVSFRGDAPARDTIVAMCDAIISRGPDEAGYLVQAPVALGMRRLSIIDLTTGQQPIFNEDRSVCIFFNGEIYNYRELRAELLAKGHRFQTQSDTEVVLHMFLEYGPTFARRLNGMFAAALYEIAARRITLVRDHLGIKPLYYASDARGLVFGSEIKVLLESGRVERKLETDAVGEFLAWEYVPGERTLFKGIRRLAPGGLLEVDLERGTLSASRYWHLPAEASRDAGRSVASWADELDAVVAAAVRRQMVADVPLGAFLSGGVDSSLVVAAMGADAHTFSIGFEDPSYDESRWSRRVADHLGVQHTVEVIKPDVRALFERLMYFMDDPIVDFSIFPTYLVSRVARQHVKVALSGDGGDELFGGYETYLAQEQARSWERIPHFLRKAVLEPMAAAMKPGAAKKGLRNKVKRFVEGAQLDPRLGHARWRLFTSQALQAQLLTRSAQAAITTPVDAHILALNRDGAALDERARTLYVDQRSYLVDNCLVKTDRMSMACSLEVRVPFLDLEVLDLAARLPSSLKFGRRQTKILLKQVAARHVPHDCIYRGKQGFSMPMKDWLRSEFAPLLDEYLAPDRVAAEGLFEPATVARLRSEHAGNIANHSHVLWGLLMLGKWREQWKVSA